MPVPLLREGIAWYTDKNIKFRNPKIENLTLAQVFEGKIEWNLDQTQFSKYSSIPDIIYHVCFVIAT